MEIFIEPSREQWAELCSRSRGDDSQVASIVSALVQRVAEGGDEALRAIALEIDGSVPASLEVTADEFAQAEAAVSAGVKAAVEQAIANVEAFHRAQLPSPVEMETMPGVRCIQKPVAIQSVGLYIPGGTAPLFSTVIMLAVPAKVAGCAEVVLCTPVSRQTGKVSPEVLYTAKRCGIGRVFKVGGAQAIAAMAYGTATIPKVDKIFGPGNRFVTSAKQLLGGKVVAIDMPAGPSEVMVVADDSASPAYAAADLLSQAEHGSDSQVMLVCRSKAFADSVMQELEAQTARLSRANYVEGAMSKSRTVVFADYDSMMDFANEYAPEHLEVQCADRKWWLENLTAYGSLFLGEETTVAYGDKCSGPNHVLPTKRAAKYSGGLSVHKFMKTITWQELTREAAIKIGEVTARISRLEGMEAHARTADIRLEKYAPGKKFDLGEPVKE